MATATIEHATAAVKSNVEKISSDAKDNAKAVSKSGAIAMEGFQELAKAYQDLAARNVEKLGEAFKELSTVKTPAEFFEVQQKLIKESFDAAVSDSRAIAELTASVFSSASEPMQKRFSVI
jgi:phasin family protein